MAVVIVIVVVACDVVRKEVSLRTEIFILPK